MDVMDLSTLEYKMNEIETKAYKCALVWTKVCQKMFPNERCGQLKKKGDPRKSYLFKCCYKLVSETSGKILDEDYKLYIYAQCDMLRGISNGETHAHVDPNCLFGEKAWWRWQIWKKKYDIQAKYKSSDVKIAPASDKIIKELVKTKAYLVEVFGRDPTQEDLQTAERNKVLFKWLHFGRISPYLIVTCPYLSDVGYGIDMGVYKEHITPEVETWFRENFK